MLVLTETTDNIQVVLGGAVETNQLQCLSSWRDVTDTTYVAGRTVTNTNSTTDVNVVPAPASSTKRVVDLINIYNKDTTVANITVKLDADGTEYILYKGSIDAGETLCYIEGLGWDVFNNYLGIKAFTVHGNAAGNFTMTNATEAERFAGNTTRHLFMVDLYGYSQVRLRSNCQVGSVSANTPVFRAKYYTSYSSTVGDFLTLGTSEVEFSVTSAGYKDTGWIDLVAGAKANGICIGFTEAGGNAAADPSLGATDILFR